jgi:flagellar protein FliS
MIGPSRDQALTAYQTVANHGGVAAADPQGLVLMLLDGALERTARLRIAIVEKNYTEKARAINRTLGILDELRGSLDFEAGGEIARNLDALYDYCSRQLLGVTVSLNLDTVDEVLRLLNHVRLTWLAVRAEAAKPAAA